MLTKVKVAVPATTANCGPGFDAVGISCTLYNHLELELCPRERLQIEVTGEGASLISTGDDNLAWRAAKMLFQKVGFQYSGIRLTMHNRIPLARGLGSSAAAVVGALVAANALAGNKLDKEQLLALATDLEGHPDNVGAALYGGVTVSALVDGAVKCLNFIPPSPLSLVAAIPDIPLSTQRARQVLPSTVSRQDAVFNISRTALLIAALGQGRWDYLPWALEDRLHQPYRQQLIPGMEAVFDAAKTAGALGVTISGAGTCLMAWAIEREAVIGQAMVTAFARYGIQARYEVLNIDREGTKIIE